MKLLEENVDQEETSTLKKETSEKEIQKESLREGQMARCRDWP